MRVTLSIILFFTFIHGYSQCNPNPPATFYIANTGDPSEIYRPNLYAMGVRGGDSVMITGTNYTVIEFFGSYGDSCRPIVIKPQTSLVTGSFRIKGNSRYLKIISDSITRTIKVNGVYTVSKAHHIESIGVEAYGGSLGVYCRLDVEYGDTSTYFGNYVMNKISFKHFYVHDVTGEGFYIGPTTLGYYTVHSTYSGLDTLIAATRLDSVEVSNCIVRDVQWDGVQLSNCQNGARIFNNNIYNYGTLNLSGQQAGIILGGNTNGDVYNNTVRRGTGNSIQFFGYGLANIYNNYTDSSGYSGRMINGIDVGDQVLYFNDNFNPIEIRPAQRSNVYGNTFKHYQKCEAVRIANYGLTSGLSNVSSNVFCIPSENPANWQSQYIIVNPAGSTVANNVLSCDVDPPTPPVGGNILVGRTKYVN